MKVTFPDGTIVEDFEPEQLPLVLGVKNPEAMAEFFIGPMQVFIADLRQFFKDIA